MWAVSGSRHWGAEHCECFMGCVDTTWEFPKIRGTFKRIYKGSYTGSNKGSIGFRV